MERLTDIAATGDRLKSLEALRDKLALAIDVVNDAGELSSLALRFQRVLAEIAELGGKAKEEDDDDLAERRRSKLSAAANS